MGYSSIAWLPLCAGLTVLAGRRRGYLSMLRGAAWSLLPIAAYLTGSVEMFWKIGGDRHCADGFVFSPVKWAGIAVAGISAVLFAATRGRERRRAVRACAASTTRPPSGGSPAPSTTSSPPSPAATSPARPSPSSPPDPPRPLDG